MPTIAVLGTFDTKGNELTFIGDAIRREGLDVLSIDVGSFDAPGTKADVSRTEVLASSQEDWQTILARKDRGECVALMSRVSAHHLSNLVAENKVHGVISLGGSGGTAIGTAAMRSLPIGFPKVMVSTLSSGDTSAYVGTVDIVMIPTIVDVAGINRISSVIFENAASAVCGMTKAAEQRRRIPPAGKSIVVASMFGNTTVCVDEARKIIEQAGFEVLVFHATGTGGRAMESLIESGMVAGVLDITTTEWADELIGGVLTAGPGRLDAAAKANVPSIVVPGCLDMVNFGEPATIPEQFKGRNLYHHNPQITLMRTTATECEELGRILAEKVNQYQAPTTVLIPRRAISIISAPGQPFYDPVADEALFNSIKSHLKASVPLIEMDAEINAPAFARRSAETLLSLMRDAGTGEVP